MIDQLRVERQLALKRRGDGPPDESGQPPAPASRRRRRDQRVPRLVERRQNRCVVAAPGRVTMAAAPAASGRAPSARRCSVDPPRPAPASDARSVSSSDIGATGSLRTAAGRRERRATTPEPFPAPGCSPTRTCAVRSARRGRRGARLRPPASSPGAIATGSGARAIAVFIRTPSAPSSIAIAASDAVPTPASTITGTRACSRMIRMLFAVLDAEPGADRRAERHHRGGAGLLELPADDRIVVGVRQDDEPFADEHARRLEQRDVVGEERPFVADHLELHPVRQADFAAEPRGADRLLGRVAAGGIRQDEDARLVDLSRAAIRRRARSDSTRRTATVTISVPDARCASAMIAMRRVFAGADDQARAKCPVGDGERVRRHDGTPGSALFGARDLGVRRLEP